MVWYPLHKFLLIHMLYYLHIHLTKNKLKTTRYCQNTVDPNRTHKQATRWPLWDAHSVFECIFDMNKWILCNTHSWEYILRYSCSLALSSILLNCLKYTEIQQGKIRKGPSSFPCGIPELKREEVNTTPFFYVTIFIWKCHGFHSTLSIKVWKHMISYFKTSSNYSEMLSRSLWTIQAISESQNTYLR